MSPPPPAHVSVVSILTDGTPGALLGQIRSPHRPAHAVRGLGSSHRHREGLSLATGCRAPRAGDKSVGAEQGEAAGASTPGQLTAQPLRSPLDGVWSRGPRVGARRT